MGARKKAPGFRVRLHIGIAAIFVAIVAALSAGIIWNNHQESSSVALQTADQLFLQIAKKTKERLDGAFQSVRTTVDAASAMPGFAVLPDHDGLLHPALETMLRLADARRNIYSIFAGYASGDWLQVIAVRGDPDVRKAFEVPEGTAFVVRAITRDRDGARTEYFRYLNRRRQVISARTIADPSYDPRERGWYTRTLAAHTTVVSAPFIFFQLQKPGLILSRRMNDGGGAVAIGITLSDISRFLSEQRASANLKMFLFDSTGHVLAHHDPSISRSLVENDDPEETSPQKLLKAEEIADPLVAPIVRAALASDGGRIEMRRVDLSGQTFLVEVEPVGLRLGLDQFVAIAAPLSDFTGHINRMQQRTIIYALIALAIALPLIYLIARRVAAKLRLLVAEADKIRRFDLDDPIELETVILEVHDLAQAFGSMKQAIGVFGRYVPKALVRQIIKSGGADDIAGRRQQISVLFTDVAGFTKIAELTDPEDLMQRTSMYFDKLGRVLSRHHGVVDKYMGDAVMALWNAPNLDEDHVVHACTAVLACRQASRELAESWESQRIPAFRTRLGLHCGEAVVGNVGGADRINFTALGATVNLAARLEALNKIYGTDILVSENVVNEVGERFLTRWIDRVQPAGIAAPTDVYTLEAAASDLEGAPTSLKGAEWQIEFCRVWAIAAEFFRNQDWRSAQKEFETLLGDFTEDAPTLLMIERCQRFIAVPPDPRWDGVTRMSAK